ncbi:hypothetical protein GQX73_g10915 [Xylaria multiplex]|uniref:Protein kinase domain-containing protein n=1 Tax=Xylaria multiplex TaxID=323545 RepID=A0A7C8MZB9_9PEZI|nr:hypothetical protein GQX73_g10915 [Xylaria multiplex]
MAATTPKDLNYREFKEGETLPFRPDPSQPEFAVVPWVKPTPEYVNIYPDSLVLKTIQLKFKQDEKVELFMAFAHEGSAGGYFAIVMDRAEGNIQKYLGSPTVSLVERQQFIPGWFGCLAEAVSHIHDIGIKHRDIKPANILVKHGSVLLADFGISKMGLGKTLSTTVPNEPRGRTPKYAAPEVGDGSTRGRAADIFSLGAVFLEMLVALYDVNDIQWDLSKVIDTLSNQGSQQPEKSFGKRVGSVQEWMGGLDTKLKEDWHRDILHLCREMMKEEREDRLSAEAIRLKLSDLSCPDSPLGPCRCRDTDFTDGQKLIKACKRKDGIEDVQRLLREGDKDLKNTKGAIHQASARGYVDIVKVFMDSGVSPDMPDYGNRTPLHCAASYGQDEAFDLLSKNSDVNLKDEEEQTPLHCAR